MKLIPFCNLDLEVLQVGTSNRVENKGKRTQVMGSATLKWVLQLHKDVPKAAQFYSEGLDFTLHLCTLRWAHLQSGPLNLALLQPPSWYIPYSLLICPCNFSILFCFTIIIG